VHQYNDCLILTTALLRSGEPLNDGLSPLMILKDRSDPSDTICGSLRDALADPGAVASQASRYHRYLHGHRTVTALALGPLSLADLRVALKAACYGLLLFAATWAVLRWVTRRPTEEVWRVVAWLVITAGFAALYGLEYFGQSLSHGMSDVVVFAFLALGATAPAPRAMLIAAALFGAFTAHFEYLTGGLPLGAAVLLAVTALDAGPDAAGPALWRLAVTRLAAYLSAFGVSFVLKLAASAALMGGQVLQDFGGGLAFRVGRVAVRGGELGLRDLIDHLRWNVDQLTFGSEGLGYGLVAGAIGIGAAATVMLLGRYRRGLDTGRELLVLLSILVIPVWYIVFLNHTVAHAWFMVRLLTWVFVGSMLLGVFLWLRLFRAPGRAEGSVTVQTAAGTAASI
jgi:hypothetical protein